MDVDTYSTLRTRHTMHTVLGGFCTAIHKLGVQYSTVQYN